MSQIPQINLQAIRPNGCAPPPVFPVPPQTTPSDCIPCGFPALPHCPPPAQAPSPRIPAYPMYITSTGPVANKDNMIGNDCYGSYASICGGGTATLLMDRTITSGSTIALYIKGGGPNCCIYVYIGSPGAWTSVMTCCINRSYFDWCTNATSASGPYLALSVVGDCCIDVACAISM